MDFNNLPDIEKGETFGGIEGYVYLIHFSEPIYHAQHYLGFATDLKKRLKEHSKGRGSKLVAEAIRRKIELTIVRLWSGDGFFEQKLKRRKEGPKFCPVCNSKCKINYE